MSSMLEQAIIDAETLRETALKNAEATLVEKYQDKIKDAVDTLLEQDETITEEPILDELPLGASQGEKACPCPDEGEEVDINLNDLMQQMQDDPAGANETESQEDLAGEFGAEEELMESLEKIVEELDEDDVYEEKSLEEDEEINLEEEDLAELVEKLTVETQPAKSGWAGTPQAVLDEAEEDVLAMEQDTEVREEREAKNKALKDLQKENKKLQKKNKKLLGTIEEIKSNENKLLETVGTLKNKFDEMSLLNAKLLYKNRTFTNNSLNERQKEHIVEALSKAQTVEEAKTIFETLQNTVDSTSNKRTRSESLSEAVNRPSSTILLSKSRNRAENSKKDDPSYTRWKALAGLE